MGRSRLHRAGGTALALVLTLRLGPLAADPTPPPPTRDLTSLSIEELSALEVVTASRKTQKLSEVPAAVTVITGEDLRRAGFTRLSHALRLAPGLHVARVDSHQSATGIRGFTGTLSRAMLVLIDGRSVYTPLFAGVYWQVQDTLLEDVDRIEVIRGPGGSLWGANAVNGVINVITKSADSTQGGLTQATIGSEELSVAARYGGKAGRSGRYRAYIKYFDRDAAFHPTGNDYDDWSMGQTGFRVDTPLREKDALTVQGDLYDGKAGERVTFAKYEPPFTETVEDEADLAGGNLQARWRHQTDGGSELAVQFYFDRTERTQAQFLENRNTFDLDVQHRVQATARHEIVYGLGYRYSTGTTDGVSTVVFEPSRRGDSLFSAFAQDTIQLRPERLRLILGSKFEHNDYSGFEVQPTARLWWSPAEDHAVWGAISRAVRTPSRVEHDLQMTALLSDDPLAFARVVGNREFDAERFLVYEVGYRAQASPRVFVDVAAFYNRATRLMSLEQGAPFQEPQPPPEHTVLPFVFENDLAGRIRGFEIGTSAMVLPWWRLQGSYSNLHMDLSLQPGATDVGQEAAEGASPRHQVGLHSSMNPFRAVEIDLFYRWVDRLPSQNVDAYHEIDLRLAWRPGPRWELAAVGEDLLHDHHAEFGGGVEIERAVRFDVTRRW